MAKYWSTKDLLGWYKREILVWYRSLNHFYFKFLLRLFNIGIIPRRLSNVRKLPPCVACLFGKPTRDHGGPKANAEAGQSGNPWRPELGP